MEKFTGGFDQNEKGEILVAGHTRESPLSKNFDVQMKKLDEQGREQWTKFFGQPRGYAGKWIHDEVWGARATPDGGWLAVAGTGDETERYEGRGHPTGPSGQWKIYLIKTDAMGNLQWEGVYGSLKMIGQGKMSVLPKMVVQLLPMIVVHFGFTKSRHF